MHWTAVRTLDFAGSGNAGTLRRRTALGLMSGRDEALPCSSLTGSWYPQTGNRAGAVLASFKRSAATQTMAFGVPLN